MDRRITRREAIKRMGSAAVGLGLGVGGVRAFDMLDDKDVIGKMKVLLVNGSPHRMGCTHTALAEVESVLKENGVKTDYLWIGNKPVAGCIACGACRESGRCFVGDPVNDLLDKVQEYDGFVFGAPVHFSALPGSMTCFMNRLFYCSRVNKDFEGKIAASVTSCRRAGSIAALDQFNRYFVYSGMPVVPSQYWPMVFGNEPEEVLQDKEGLQIMRTLGRNMLWMLKNREAGAKLDILYPEQEERVSTNFIR